ncbi:hypothetical protein [Streptomyces sp.]|uniref:hypothetical protein n=1 Tax=Streptomyces sp. TaxID=1931 RepID=UPI0028125904|nr:hypothetical protein [Streptomyces sp.]
MTQPTDTPATGGQVIDLMDRMPPQRREALEKAARAEVQSTASGIADASTGTVQLSDEVDGQDLPVIEQVDDVARRRLRLHLPAALVSREVWQHRRAVLTHAAGYHAARSPLYLGRLVKLSSIGLWTELGSAWSYLFVTEYGEMIAEARAQAKAKGYADHSDVAQLRAERRAIGQARRRENLTVLSATGVTSYVAVVVAVAEVWGMAMAAPALLPVVGVMYACGVREVRRRTEPFAIFEQAAAAEDAPVSDSTINAALRKVKILGEDEVAELVGPIRAVSINACEATLKLPSGVTAPRVIAARDALAEALNVEASWLDVRQAGHPNRITLWIATSDPFAEARVSPLVEAPERQDVWNRGIPIGFNRRGEVVYLKLKHVMALLGGMSRTGKGMLLRSIICGLGLDPRVNIRLAAGAKPGEHIGYAPVCATFFGRRAGRLDLLLDAELVEAYRREEFLEDQGRAKLSENDLEQFPLEIVIIDESQEYTQNAGALSPDIVAKIERLAGFAAALNIVVLLVTQDPDRNTVPRKFKSNSAVRIATKTGSPTQTNAILKEGATGNGLRAHEIPFERKGLTIVDIDGAAGELIRSYFIEDEEYDGAAPVIAAGRTLRESCGRAPGQFEDPIEDFLLEATGLSSSGGGPGGRGKPGRPEVSAAEVTVLDVLLGAFPPGVDRVPLDDVRTALGDWDQQWAPRPEEEAAAYAGRIGKALGDALAEELAGTDVTLEPTRWRDGSNRVRGYLKADVEAAYEAARKIQK